jgi:hypothetical protein
MPHTRTGTPSHLSLAVALGFAMLVVAAPAGYARPIDPGYTAREPVAPAPVQALPAQPVCSHCSTLPPATTAPLRRVVLADSGFDWNDAAVGAAAVAGIVALLGAGVLLITFRREQHTAPLPH